MQKYIVYEKVTDTSGKVTLIIEDPTDEQLVKDYSFYVESADFPLPETPEGMKSVLMVRLPDNELYYDYEATPAPIDEQLAELKIRQEASEAAILALMDVTTGA